jgi:hypothetical protein
MKINDFNKNKRYISFPTEPHKNIKKIMSENITQKEYSHGLFLDYTFSFL